MISKWDDNAMSNHNPLSFIVELLNRSDISLSDRERIGVLAHNTPSGNILPAEPKSSGQTKLCKHSPREHVTFLYETFSKDDTLKWFVHSPDIQEFDYEQQMKAAKALFQVRERYKNLNPRTWMLAYNYVLSKDGYWVNYEGKRINHNWRSPELSDWCSANKGKHPAAKEYGLRFKDGSSFENVVREFKHSIRFRTDDRNLIFYKRIKSIVRKYLSQDFKIGYSEILRSCDVDTYIDVGRLLAAITKILSWISDNKAKGGDVCMDYLEDDNTISLIIFHKDSYLSIADNKLEGLSGDWSEVRSLLFSIADWKMLADRGNGGSIAISCLDENTNAKEVNAKFVVVTPNSVSEPDNTPIGGIKHIITMYKNV